jgi:hypothetical protein
MDNDNQHAPFEPNRDPDTGQLRPSASVDAKIHQQMLEQMLERRAAATKDDLTLSISIKKLAALIVAVVVALSGTGIWASIKTKDTPASGGITQDEFRELKKLLENINDKLDRNYDGVNYRLDRNLEELRNSTRETNRVIRQRESDK